MATRRFRFTVNVTDNYGHLVATIGGESVVTDDRKDRDQICQSIIDDLPRHLRTGYRYGVHLQQI